MKIAKQKKLKEDVAPHAGAWIEIFEFGEVILGNGVAPHAGAWIEIRCVLFGLLLRAVAPHAGAWIEMCSCAAAHAASMSLPTRERGLKYVAVCFGRRVNAVAPHAGAWIEISYTTLTMRPKWVAPHAGAWIEMVLLIFLTPSLCGRSPRGSVD